MSNPIIQIIPYDFDLFVQQLEDNVQRSWSVSRPGLVGGINVFDVLCIDAPITEFAHMQAEVRAPILVREVFATARNHIMWAQTSRNADLTKTEIYNYCMSETCEQNATGWLIDMEESRNKGATQDQYRLKLPLSAMTTFSVSLTWRDMVRLMKYFNQLAESAVDECVQAMFSETASQLLMLIEVIVDQYRGQDGSLSKLLTSIKPQPLLSEKKMTVFNVLSSTDKRDGIVSVGMTMSWALRAQLVRHRNLLVQDNFFERIRDCSILSSHALESLLSVSVAGTVDTWRTLVRERVCWIAQADLWKPLIDRVVPMIGGVDDFASLLPCADGTCPFDLDARQRLHGTDPGPICPRHTAIYSPDGFKLKPERVAQLRQHTNTMGNGTAAQSYWLSLIDTLTTEETFQ